MLLASVSGGKRVRCGLSSERLAWLAVCCHDVPGCANSARRVKERALLK
jgi:hypothetical protein